MTHTTVTYKGPSDNSDVKQRLDMRWLSHAISQSISSDAVKKLSLLIGNKNFTVGDFFDISSKFSDQPVVLENSNTNMDYIGHALATSVELTVKGNAGHFAGAALAGGKLIIDGNTQNYTGCSMKNGLIDITGSVDDYLGGAYTGDKKGMSGGTILVHGSSGNFTGDLRRRGTIMVVDNIGDYCVCAHKTNARAGLVSLSPHAAPSVYVLVCPPRSAVRTRIPPAQDVSDASDDDTEDGVYGSTVPHCNLNCPRLRHAVAVCVGTHSRARQAKICRCTASPVARSPRPVA